ncbi:MAG: hypothetical protein ACRYFZ_03140 [Janthinobacterium lividum]
MKITCLLVLGLGTAVSSHGQAASDSVAIKRVLEKEPATWRAGDVQGHAHCWAIRPYSRILIATGDGTVLDVPPATMLNPPPTLIGKGGSAVNSNYKMNIAGNNAWVSHDEVSTASNGVKSYSSEVRMLEKVSGEWKLVGQTVLVKKKQN